MLIRKSMSKKIEQIVSYAPTQELDKAYIPIKYQNLHPEGSPYEIYTEKEVRMLMDYAKRIIKYCEDLLSRA